MKTILIVEVEHNKPIPPELANILGNRAYNYLLNKGVQTEVKVVETSVTQIDE